MEGLAYLVIAFSFGLAGGIIGKLKGSSFFIWFLVSACVPFLGLVAAALYRNEYNIPHRKCPTCGRVVHGPRRLVHALRDRARVPRSAG